MIELSLAGAAAAVRFTTREDGDLGPTADDPGDAAVGAAREALRRACRLESIAAARQVHGARVAVVAARVPGYRVAAAAADGQATRLPGVGVAVHAADCLPVAVAGAGGVAVLHAGWRGLEAGVIDEGVAVLRRLGARGPLEATIGPGAGGCCYQAGPEVHAAFAGIDGASRGRRVDLKAVARAQLERAGVERVTDVGLCTLCAPPGLLFSHRRDGPGTGRQAGIAWLR
ncbi:MAG: purine-nucleoside/S-methyl-5-thioadenosine phosphorylase / adenosine deaminase [Solirubrobacteraceae bacterium]|jgi:YfiH family protein|nr:purine-nucleoside/S-methyl-5-thioadenosine phosphorylase / adenosine deaminase [Solirubrobacteraceae bacterium]